MVMGGGIILKVWGNKRTSKNYGKFLRCELKTVTSQALKMTSLNFVSMFKQLYAMFYKPSTTLFTLHLRYIDLST